MKLYKRILIILFLILIFTSNKINAISSITNTSQIELSTYSPNCILMEASTGKVIYEKNAYEKAYPASTTKIMTAILTLENCDLTDVAKVSYNAVYSVPSRIYKC